MDEATRYELALLKKHVSKLESEVLTLRTILQFSTYSNNFQNWQQTTKNQLQESSNG